MIIFEQSGRPKRKKKFSVGSKTETVQMIFNYYFIDIILS